MPSFLETLKRLIMGEPVFRAPTDRIQDDRAGWRDEHDAPVVGSAPTEPPVQASASSNSISWTNDKRAETHLTQPGSGSASPNPNSPIVPKQEHTTPQVVIQDRLTCLEKSNGEIELQINIRNYSQARIWLDKVRLLGVTHELDAELKPNYEREFTVYRGNRPTNTYEKTAELQYKTYDGNYYTANHLIEFEKQPDNTYVVHKIKFLPPVHDMRYS